MPFPGTFNTTRYRANDPGNPEALVLTISVDADPNSLDGTYPRPGANARMFGQLDGSGLIWSANVDEGGSTGDQGQAVFFLSGDGNTIYGAWTSAQSGNTAQPWFGTRV